MERRQMRLVLVTTIAVVGLLAVPAVGGEVGDSTSVQLDNNTTDADNESVGETNGSFGQQISAFMQASAADANASVETGMWSARVNGTLASNGTVPESEVTDRAAKLGRERQRLERKVSRLQERRDTIPEIAYSAQASALRERIVNLREQINETEQTATRAGINTSGLDELGTQTANMTGPEVSAVARNITDAPRSPPVGIPRGPPASAGPPEDGTGQPEGDTGPPDDARPDTAGPDGERPQSATRTETRNASVPGPDGPPGPPDQNRTAESGADRPVDDSSADRGPSGSDTSATDQGASDDNPGSDSLSDSRQTGDRSENNTPDDSGPDEVAPDDDRSSSPNGESQIDTSRNSSAPQNDTSNDSADDSQSNSQDSDDGQNSDDGDTSEDGTDSNSGSQPDETGGPPTGLIDRVLSPVL